MNAANIRKEYPKAWEKLKVYAKEYMTTFQNSLVASLGEDLEIPEITDDLVEEAASTFVRNDGRLLYDFFDKYNVVMTLVVTAGKWSYHISSESISGGYCPDRKSAEDEGFEQCFKMLNNETV